MTDFDDQWKKVMDEEHFNEMKGKFDFTQKRVEEFKKLTEIKDNDLNGKICLDAGCGPGRWTYAMQQLGAKKVDSFDVSSEAIKRCREINPDANEGSIFYHKPLCATFRLSLLVKLLLKNPHAYFYYDVILPKTKQNHKQDLI